MNSLTRSIINQAHPASLVLGCGSVMSGLTASVIRGSIDLFPALMTLIFAALLQLTVNLYNGYRMYAGVYAKHHDEATMRRADSVETKLMKVITDALLILTVTVGLPLLTYIGWIGVVYLVVILTILHFNFKGPRPLVRTPWALLVTFVLFGPIGVTGTALVQNLDSPVWMPLVTYSIINGLMAVNAHIAVMYATYQVDIMQEKQTLLVTEGVTFTRSLFLLDTFIVCLLLVARQCVSEIVSIYVAIVIALFLLLSSIWVFARMTKDPLRWTTLLMKVTKTQYILLILVMMTVVICSISSVSVNIFQEY